MTEWEKALSDKLSKYSEEEFNYIDTKDITKADEIDYGSSGIYMESTIIYLEIKNLQYILKENGRRKAAQAYTMLHTVVTAIAKKMVLSSTVSPLTPSSSYILVRKSHSREPWKTP